MSLCHAIGAETSVSQPRPRSSIEFECEAKAQRHDNARRVRSGLSVSNRLAGLFDLSCAAAAAASHTSFISSGTSATLTVSGWD